MNKKKIVQIVKTFEFHKERPFVYTRKFSILNMHVHTQRKMTYTIHIHKFSSKVSFSIINYATEGVWGGGVTFLVFL